MGCGASAELSEDYGPDIDVSIEKMTVNGPHVVLVDQNSEDVCFFSEATMLRKGADDCRLTLQSHLGLALCAAYPKAKNSGGYSYIELAFGASDDALHVRMEKHNSESDGGFIIRESDGRAFDVSTWPFRSIKEGSQVRILKGLDSMHPTKLISNESCREFVVNPDGSISPHKPRLRHLVLGLGKPRLVLLEKGDSKTIYLEKLSQLRKGRANVPLSIENMPGMSINMVYREPQTYKDNQYVELCVGIQNDECAVKAGFNNMFLECLHVGDGSAVYVFDALFGKLQEGNQVNLVCGSRSSRTYTGKGRQFVLNDDGSISPVADAALVLGVNYHSPDVARPLSPGQYTPPPVANVSVAELETAVPKFPGYGDTPEADKVDCGQPQVAQAVPAGNFRRNSRGAAGA